MTSYLRCSNASSNTPGRLPVFIPPSRIYSSLALEAIAIAAYINCIVLFAALIPLKPPSLDILSARTIGSIVCVSSWYVIIALLLNLI